MDTFRLRLNCIDHYQSSPTHLDPPLWGLQSRATQQTSPLVPIIRVFGATETGQKVCAHIHGAFPYLYLEYEEGRSLQQDDVSSYIATLRSTIDHALAVSFRRNNYDGKAIYVAHISLVKGVPFFGYQVGYKYFLKVYLLNPLHMTRLADLLHSGVIMKRVFQPYESHLQFLLQWMCDFNLYGCAYIDTDKPYFRTPIPEWAELNSDEHKWHDKTIRKQNILGAEDFVKQSHCSIEVDICVQDILNRKEVVGRPLHHDFMERFTALGIEEKLVQSMAGLWKDETKRRKKRMGIVDPGSSPFPTEVLVSMSADPRKTDKGGWIHEEEFRDLIQELVNDEKVADGRGNVNFSSFVKPKPEENDIQTTLESVEELFLDKVRNALTTESGRVIFSQGHVNPVSTQIVIDEKTLSQFPVKDDDDDGEYEGERFQRAVQPVVNTKPEASEVGEAAPHKQLEDPSTPRSRKRFLPPTPQSVRKKKVQISTSPVKSAPWTKDSDPPTSTGSDRQKVAKSSMQSSDTDQSNRQSKQDMIPKQSSQEPLRLSQSFQVVKDASNSDTIFRLSQSGKTDKGVKNVSSNEVDSPSSVERSLNGSNTKLVSTTQQSSWKKLVTNYKHFGSTSLLYRALPPTAADVRFTLENETGLNVIYQDAYYSDEKDVPDRAREYGGQEFKLESTTLPFLPDFDASASSTASRGDKAAIVVDKAKEVLYHQKRRWQCNLRTWEIEARPPSRKEVRDWLKTDVPVVEAPKQTPMVKIKRQNRPDPDMSQITGPTQRNKHGFKYSQKKKSTSVQHETQYMSIMSLEVHVNSRHDFAPDPEHDEIAAIFWCLKTDDEALASDGIRTGILILDVDGHLTDRVKKQVNVEIEHETEELDLINHMVDIVREFDPDVLAGYEVHNSSWGYLMERARLKYEFDLPDEFSRMKAQSHGRFGKDADRWGFTTSSTIRVTGRHMINIWRAMRGELNLLQYTMENVVFHLLHRRIPHYSFEDLTTWYKSPASRDLAKTLDYFLTRVQLDLDILDVNELIPRTSEQARLLGVDFFSVFSRGSQFKVESLMFRIAKPESFVLVSPSRKQVGHQNALECLPLVMEPQSAFYSSPLLVLDFQSLYPSVMIAYNYCYSTCLGRVTPWRGINKLGFADFKRAPRLLELVKDHINIAPNGMMYVRPEMRKSLLAKMLGEILETRVMVKSGMKVDKDDRTLQQLLNNRQLALKLIANVTYGYTSASFSGRMPCSEIADSIVQTGRETLEKTIAFIHATSKWGAEVVYGDTDSLFVYLKGKTRDQAFVIGNEIVSAVTAMNPRPIKLKFEKVYHPCVLLAKKRYVGYKYEYPSQTVPEFDAKGIETVRRDGTPAEQKIEEKCLKLLFETADLSIIKSYFQDQCRKIMLGKVSVQDFCFAKEVKLGTYAERGPPPPGALIATKRMLKDPRKEPQYGERVPYVVIAGAPGARLFERCVEPERLLFDDNVELDAEYYINKNLIPPLERIFNLVGANVRSWFDEMPRIQRVRNIAAHSTTINAIAEVKKATMENYMSTSFCLLCSTKLVPNTVMPFNLPSTIPICANCLLKDRLSTSITTLYRRLMRSTKQKEDVDSVCRSCSNLPFGDTVTCDSRDCNVFYTRVKVGSKLRREKNVIGGVLRDLEAALDCDVVDQVETSVEW